MEFVELWTITHTVYGTRAKWPERG